jgi:tetratricopeptide (TPR) repeat protein
MADAPTASLNALVERVAELLATDPSAAERAAERVLARTPKDPRALLILGSARRRRGDMAGARLILEPLAKAYPRAAHTQYEIGLLLAADGDRPAAISSLRQATAVNRDLAEAWRALGEQLFEAGDVEGAERAFAEHERAAVKDPRLKPAADALFDGDLVGAEQRLRRELNSRPNDVQALRLLAEVFGRQSRWGDAELLLGRCLELDPSHDGARFGYATALFHQQMAVQALPHVQRLLEKDATDAAYRNLLAACLGLIGDHDRVNAIYEGLLAQYPTQPRLWLNYGHALRTVRRQAEAVNAYKRCISLSPGLGDAYWSLANLKIASFSPEDEATMAAQLDRQDLSADDRLHLCYALGKALEDRKAFGESMRYYSEGARIRLKAAPYDADAMTALTERTQALFTRSFFADRAAVGLHDEAPIFVVGLPRAGSTLIEQILASHSAVEGTMELPDINLIARSLGRVDGEGPGPRYPEILATLGSERFAELGAAYIAATRVHRKLGRPYFIDKMPNNFMHVGFIHAILPKAKIIDARRHPMGSCFSAFKQHFNQGQNFSYNLTDLGRFYHDYVALMAHFDQVLPNRIHRVIYEDVVEDTETEVRRLLDYCGLAFEPACLKFYENARAVRTVSSEQVRRPIFRDGLEQWRNYEPWLAPLKLALGPALETWR